MRSPPFGTIGPGSAPVASWEIEGGVAAASRAPGAPGAPRHIVRSGKRPEDTSAGCRANAAADIGRAHAPGGDFRRLRLELSAAIWTERADLLERLERKVQLRTDLAAAASAA